MKFNFVDDTPTDVGTLDGGNLLLTYTKMQETIFLNSTAKYTIVSAGRRSGKTAGAAQFFIDDLLGSNGKNYLWVEVSYGQILTYYDRYFYPILSKLSPDIWSWNQQRRDLRIMDNVLSFRSADRPDLLVGLGYNKIVMNECGIQLFEHPEIWTQILAPMMLDDPVSQIWMIGTPRGLVSKDGKDNLFYTMWCKGQEDDPTYKSYKYTSYDNPFLDKDAIKALEEEVPPLLRAQELYAEFINTSELQIFKPEWWQYTDKLPELTKVYKKFISIDSAFSEKTTADESAMTVWYKLWTGQFICVFAWHGHLSYPDLVSKTKEFIIEFDPDTVVVENKASGQSLIQTLQRDLSEISVVKWPPEGTRLPDKVSRATSVTSYLEQGKVLLYKGHWNKDLVNQCTVFPIGQNDDLVDSFSMALLYGKMTDGHANPFVTRKIQTSRVVQMDNPTDIIKSYSLHKPNQYRGF